MVDIPILIYKFNICRFLNLYYHDYILFSEQYVVYNVGLISSQYYLVLGNKDYDGFVSVTIYSIVLVTAISGVIIIHCTTVVT